MLEFAVLQEVMKPQVAEGEGSAQIEVKRSIVGQSEVGQAEVKLSAAEQLEVGQVKMKPSVAG